MSGISFQPSEPRSKVTEVWATSPFSETAGKPTCSAVAGLTTDGGRPSLASAMPSIAANSVGVLLDGREVGLGQPAVTFVDDDGGDGVGVLERLELLEGAGGLG